MNNVSPPTQPASVLIDGKPAEDGCGVRFDCRTLEILLPGRQRISIYAFNTLMLLARPASQEIDRFILDGPKLGLYHDTADIREGPYIKHYLSHIEVSIAYPSNDQAHITVSGRADLAKSAFDSYWYKGPTTGQWSFEASFAYSYPNLRSLTRRSPQR